MLETNQDLEQFLLSIYRYIQLGVYVRAYLDKETKKFVREIAEVTEFYVTKDNKAEYNTIYKKYSDGRIERSEPSSYLRDYLSIQGVILPEKVFNGNTDNTSNNNNTFNTNGINNIQNNVEVLFE